MMRVRKDPLGIRARRFQRAGTPPGRSETLAQQRFSVERVTGIEPAWSAWKASGTRSSLSVKMAVDLRISVLILTAVVRSSPDYRPYGPAKDALRAFAGPRPWDVLR